MLEVFVAFQTKVTLKTAGQDSVFQLQNDAKALGLVTSIVRDAGF